MLGPFNHTPSPGEDRRVTHAVVWVTLALVLLMTLISVVLPPSDADLPQEAGHQEADSSQDFLALPDSMDTRSSPSSTPILTGIR